MDKILRGLINNRKIVIFVIVLLFIYGIYNYQYIPKNYFGGYTECFKFE